MKLANGLMVLFVAGSVLAGEEFLNAQAVRDAQGQIIVLGTEGGWQGATNVTKRAVFDGNPATYFDPPFEAMAGACWAGIELPKPKMLTRLRYLGRDLDFVYSRVWGCRFQGANRADFKDAVTLHVAAPLRGWKPNKEWIEVKLTDATAQRAFRFFRVIAPNPYPPDSFGCCGGNFAEVEFYGTDLPAGIPGVVAHPVTSDSLDEALALCQRTYDYVAKVLPPKEMKLFRHEMKVNQRWASTAATPQDRAMVEKIVRRLRRRILFAHPDLQFDRLICVQRDVPFTHFNHMVDQYLGRFSKAGPGLIALDNWRTFPEKKLLLAGKLPEGCVLNPDLNWDADRILFSFCDHTRKPEADPDALKIPEVPALRPSERPNFHRRYFIYECASDGSWVRQLTGCAGDPMETMDGRQTVLIEDWDPCYLPDGGFAFTSTRCQNFGRCHWGRYTPSFTLYRAELPTVGAAGAVAQKIRPLSFGEANEWEPTVMNDGRLAYTRWDYIDRNAILFQSLWAMRPDGTSVSHLYGNYSRSIAVLTEAKAIPGSTELVATAGAHHMVTGGSLVLFDARQGEDFLQPITRLTPEIPFPETEGWKFPGFYAAPVPVNDTLFFASYIDDPGWYPSGHPKSVGGMSAWPEPRSSAIWLVDKLGGRELIYRDPTYGTFNPIPLVKRPKPPVLTNAPGDSGEGNTGVCYVENCYESRQNLPKGSIAALRINRFHNLPICCRETPNLGNDLSLHKETLGIVPVSPEGAAAFRIPSGMPIQLQAIDTNGIAILTMRSFIYTQKGEVQGCTGCHEDKRTSRGAVKRPAGMKIEVPRPEVDLGYTGPFRYALSVQPIFDRKCISCHGLGKAPSFIGAEGHHRLIRDRQIDYIHGYSETDVTVPGKYFAGGSPLTKRLLGGHGPKLTPEEWRTLVLWMDLAVPEHSLGGYGWNRPETRAIDPAGEKALRAAVARELGAAIAAQPFDALVNRGDETKSRVLWLCKPAAREELLALCRRALKPHPVQDIQGTCGRDDNCQCRSCWVRRGKYNQPKGNK
ncbi:MAG: hypothetical protein MJ249_00505 [Kiritimatiellae bacterium]|nr:hypothetical protein [Kiritimatiellia bacterium]